MKKALIFLTLIFSLQSISMAQVTEGFEDDFTDNTGAWPESNNENVFSNVENGQYILEHKRKQMSWMFFKSVFVNPDKDFYIESKMTQLAGVDDDGYGIVFGMSGIQNYYSFVVSSDGRCFLYGYKNNEYFSSQGWTKGDGINKKKTANVLGIKKNGSYDFFFCKWHTHVYAELSELFWSLSRICSES
ncbi:MAG: hypothetical protein ACJ75J_10895 [Cytophagaceae bacterium]